ncbi:Major Facilitator Superfamily (MFS) [Achlya hypogyna]|uniref:Hexose transporter 1 n=1 Tax=Achlya hypogyna TaxID=1202772 RepID=A0A1V9YQG3_ACHHY|nr:Major Facilitator Superfamily (MFS) [Achlya hypogyna]
MEQDLPLRETLLMSESPPPTRATSAGSNLKLAAYLVALSSFLWGYGFCVLNVCIAENATGSILVDFALSDGEIELASSLVLIGAWVSALLTASMADTYGRRKVLLGNNVLFVAGALACALARTKGDIYIGRTIIGFACGIVTNVTPILLAEMSPTDCRGQITTLHQLMLTIGILGSSLLGYGLVSSVPSGWRYVNAFLGVPAVLQCMLLPWIPESPRWLLATGADEKARAQLFRLRNPVYETDIDVELKTILHDMNNDKKSEPKEITFCGLWVYKRPMLIGSFLVFFQAMTGINTVMLYSSKIFHFAGVDQPIMATASVGTINVITTVASVYLVDYCGRKILLLISSAAMALSLGVLSYTLLYLSDKLQGVLAVVCVLVFVAGFAIGLGAVIWHRAVPSLNANAGARVVLGELTPSAIRSRAMGVFMAISYACNVFVATCTLGMIKALGAGHKDVEKNGIAKLYLICGLLSVLCFLFIAKWVPETKGLRGAAAYDLLAKERAATDDDATPRSSFDDEASLLPAATPNSSLA